MVLIWLVSTSCLQSLLLLCFSDRNKLLLLLQEGLQREALYPVVCCGPDSGTGSATVALHSCPPLQRPRSLLHCPSVLCVYLFREVSSQGSCIGRATFMSKVLLPMGLHSPFSQNKGPRSMAFIKYFTLKASPKRPVSAYPVE